MPTDVRLAEVHHSIRDDRAAQAADKAERIRRRPELAQHGTPEEQKAERRRRSLQRASVRRWKAGNRDRVRGMNRGYRERNKGAELARVSEWKADHRVYLAAYNRVRRVLKRDHPDMPPMELRRLARIGALKEAAWTGEVVG